MNEQINYLEQTRQSILRRKIEDDLENKFSNMNKPENRIL